MLTSGEQLVHGPLAKGSNGPDSPILLLTVNIGIQGDLLVQHRVSLCRSFVLSMVVLMTTKTGKRCSVFKLSETDRSVVLWCMVVFVALCNVAVQGVDFLRLLIEE